MFDSLSDRLNDTFDRLRGKGKLTEADITSAMRDIRMALLEADVNFKVVKEFVAKTKERCMTAEVMESLSPAQNVVKIVLDELTEMLGSTESKLVFSNRIPNVIMLVGLQGSGKTTAAVKLAYLLKKQGRSPLLAACDVYRPAAADQLATLGGEIGVPVFRGDGAHPVDIAKGAIQEAVDHLRDVVIVDTAGRLQIDEQMMQEAVDIKKAVKPDQVLMVVDAMTGQDIVNVVSTFAERTDFDGVIISKLDGDARGGGALSVRQVTGKPIKFVSMGEKPDSLEPFYPDRMAKRILGMGDVVGIIEKAQEAADAEQLEAAERMLREGFTMNDMLDQMKAVKAVAYGAVRLSVRIVSTSVARTHFWSVAASDIASSSTVCFPAITHANISTSHFSDGASRIPTQVSFILSSARTRSLTSAYNCAYVFLTVVPPSSYKSATLSG